MDEVEMYVTSEVQFFHRRWQGWSQFFWWCWPIRWYLVTEYPNGTRKYYNGLSAADCHMELARKMREIGVSEGIEKVQRVQREAAKAREKEQQDDDPVVVLENNLDKACWALQFYANWEAGNKIDCSGKTCPIPNFENRAKETLDAIRNPGTPLSSWEEYRKEKKDIEDGPEDRNIDGVIP